MDKVLRLVKDQCRYHGVTFVHEKVPSDVGGFFDDTNKILSVSTDYIDNHCPRPKARPLRGWQLYALHEMVHMWQWARKDPNWTHELEPGQCLRELILQYEDGDAWYPKEQLKESAKSAMAIEFEAERVSIILADSLGVDYPRARMVRAAKVYVYSYYFLAVTGWVGSMNLGRKFARLVSNSLEFDLTPALLQSMIDIAKANPHLIKSHWKGKKFLDGPPKL